MHKIISMRILLLACVYSLLTIATTTDARLLTNSASSPLPILQAEIPIVGFYWVASLLLLCLYGYLHLYLQRLWEELSDLPGVFPDGRSLDKRASFWLLNGLVRSYFARLRDNPLPLSRLQKWLSILLAWWVVPVTLFVFWGRYLRRHDWGGTTLRIALLVMSIGGALFLHRLAAATLRGHERTPISWVKAWRDVRAYKRGAVVLGIGLIFSVLSYGAINGVPNRSPEYIVVSLASLYSF